MKENEYSPRSLSFGINMIWKLYAQPENYKKSPIEEKFSECVSLDEAGVLHVSK